MTQEHIQALKEIAEEVGGDFTDYSGRNMYGKRCAAISTTSPEYCREKALEAGIRGAYTDRLGKAWIIYWPSIPYEGEAG
jgi:hypothetical protein